MDDFKWYFIAVAIIFSAMFISVSIENSNQKEIIVACYEAGKLNCEQLINNIGSRESGNPQVSKTLRSQFDSDRACIEPRFYK